MYLSLLTEEWQREILHHQWLTSGVVLQLHLQR